jgi:hypothetical protein
MKALTAVLPSTTLHTNESSECKWQLLCPQSIFYTTLS